MERTGFSLRQVFVAAAIIIVFLMMADFNSRWNEKQRLEVQYEQAIELREQLISTLMALEDQIEYASSDAAVEAWAYSEGSLARPGDVVIQPMPAPGEIPAPTPTPLPPEPVKTNLDVWWSLFFDNESE